MNLKIITKKILDIFLKLYQKFFGMVQANEFQHFYNEKEPNFTVNTVLDRNLFSTIWK